MRFFQQKKLFSSVTSMWKMLIGGHTCLLVQVILWFTQYLIILRRKHSKNWSCENITVFIHSISTVYRILTKILYVPLVWSWKWVFRLSCDLQPASTDATPSPSHAACIHTYIHTYIQTNILVKLSSYVNWRYTNGILTRFIHTYIHTYISTYKNTYIHKNKLNILLCSFNPPTWLCASSWSLRFSFLVISKVASFLCSSCMACRLAWETWPDIHSRPPR